MFPPASIPLPSGEVTPQAGSRPSQSSPAGARPDEVARESLANAIDFSHTQPYGWAASEPGTRQEELDRLASPPSPEVIAEAMLRCITGPILDFTQLEPRYADWVAFLPVDGWEALQQYAAAQGADIASVVLPNEFARVCNYPTLAYPPLVAGLSKLPGLGRVNLPVPVGASDVDLSAMRSLQPLPAVEIRCNKPESVLRVTVPIGTPEVRAVVGRPADLADLAAAREKSLVYYVNDDGVAEDPPRTLAGLIYARTATDLLGEAPSESDSKGEALQGRREQAQQHAARINLNCQVNFPADRKGADGKAGVIKCRNLALQWLWDRASHHWDCARAAPGTDAPRARFSYQRYLSEVSIGEHVDPATESEFWWLNRNTPHSTFEAAAFGNTLADELGRLMPGQTRHFAILVEGHVMSLELRRKKDRYVVNFYDPNRTATHMRLVVDRPARLRGMSLAHWTGEEMIADHYFESGQPGRLHELSSSRFLRPLTIALAAGRADEVTAIVQSMQASPEAARDLKGEITLLEPALSEALAWGFTGAMDAYMKAILETAVLSPQERYRLLKPDLQVAFYRGRIDTVASFTRAVLAAPAGTLTRQQRLDLLSIGRGRPSLHVIASDDNFNINVDGRLRSEQAIHAHLRAILASPLSDADKAVLCASVHGEPPSTAAQAALRNGNPGVAAAMVCAVLDAFPDPERRAIWLGHLGVTQEQVLSKLEEDGDREQWREWGRHIPCRPGPPG